MLLKEKKKKAKTKTKPPTHTQTNKSYKKIHSKKAKPTKGFKHVAAFQPDFKNISS